MYTYYDSNTSTTLGSGTIPYSAIKADRISFISSHPLWTPAKKRNVFLHLFRMIAERL